jgi:hypothetical protein
MVGTINGLTATSLKTLLIKSLLLLLWGAGGSTVDSAFTQAFLATMVLLTTLQIIL